MRGLASRLRAAAHAAIVVLAAVAAAIPPAAAQQTTDASGQACVSTEGGALTPMQGQTPFVRADVRAIAEIVTCYCGCPHLQVSKCYCGTADAIRTDFAARLDRGETAEAIVAAYVAEHGASVLAVPEKKGFHWIIWIGPPLLLLLGAVFVWLAGRRMSRHAPAPELARQPLDPEAEKRYREAVRRAVEGA